MPNSKEALNKIINHKCYEKESSCWDYIKTLYKEEVESLQELVDKETPMKTIGVLHNGVTYGFCGYCGGGQHLVEHYDDKQQKWIKQGYCCHCGKKYDWSGDNG